MPKFVIERNMPKAGNMTEAQLQEISQKSCDAIRSMMKTFFLIVGLMFSFQSMAQKGAAAPSAASSAEHKMVTPKDIKWSPGPNSLPAGAQVFILSGNPQESGPFVMRLKLPANYKIPAHTHPGDENVTVISGELQMGMGDKFDEKKLMRLPASSFIQMKAGTQHFASAKKGSVIQLHGMGPWGIDYINPADDPRKANISKR